MKDKRRRTASAGAPRLAPSLTREMIKAGGRELAENWFEILPSLSDAAAEAVFNAMWNARPSPRRKLRTR